MTLMCYLQGVQYDTHNSSFGSLLSANEVQIELFADISARGICEKVVYSAQAQESDVSRAEAVRLTSDNCHPSFLCDVEREPREREKAWVKEVVLARVKAFFRRTMLAVKRAVKNGLLPPTPHLNKSDHSGKMCSQDSGHATLFLFAWCLSV
jgi:hypothetical protein